MALPSPVPPTPPALAPFPPYNSPADTPGAGGKAPLTARSGAPLSAVAGGWARALGHAVRTAGGTTADAVHPRHVYWTGTLPSVLDGGGGAAAAAADGDAEPLVVLYDGYQKARRHLLLLPARPDVAPAVDRLTSSDRSAAAALVRLGGVIAAALAADAGGGGGGGAPPPRLGFHALPSMSPLHLHLVSDDLAGSGMTSKRHYQSFSLAFFFCAAGGGARRLGRGGRVCCGCRRGGGGAAGAAGVPRVWGARPPHATPPCTLARLRGGAAGPRSGRRPPGGRGRGGAGRPTERAAAVHAAGAAPIARAGGPLRVGGGHPSAPLATERFHCGGSLWIHGRRPPPP
ncbi:hypothetical protein BU14_0880s0007 [Porphyra umbilicalis]|uniref:HIT domain-containing protein n=1 Tax=Porphyra umbilicalis TaxID=2786 RepID=A0A1X6NP92_PORUM|nr:hypothetical protein BU14_0880s0007 [Porphyra umbilicalis]|eukprot:OSX70163.1 hypothetical protein BU14_0880s0007 [Porphyra umbilicalis]